MLRYQNNAFRILGLHPSASMREIIQRVNEIKVKKSLSIDVVYEYDFPWMGIIDRSESNVTNALQRLENPISRLREEIFWFWFETDYDRQAIDCLVQNNRQAAHKTWKTLITSDIPTRKSISAFVNQAILAHSSVIGREVIVKYTEECQPDIKKDSNYLYCPVCYARYEKTWRRKYDPAWKTCLRCGVKLESDLKEQTIKQKKRNIGLDETHWKNWRFVINRLTVVASKKVFWDMVREKAQKIDDPRLSSSKVDEIRENFLQDVAKPNFTFISQALVSKDYERVKQHSSLLNGSSLSSEVLRKGFNRVLTTQIDLLNRHSQTAAKDLLKIEKNVRNSDKAVIDLYSNLVNNVEDIVYEGNLVDINCVSDFALSRDGLASVVRDSAIVLNNILVADTIMPQKERKNGYSRAYEMIRKALEYAGSTYTKQKFEKDEELIKNNLEMTRVYDSYYRQMSHAPSASGFNWKSLLIWGGIILFFIIIGNLPDNSSSYKSSPSKSSSSSSQIGTTSSVYQLRTRIENLRQSIEEKQSKLQELEYYIKSGNTTLSNLRNEIGELESKIKKAWFGKDKMIEEYNQKVNNYNTLLGIYNNVYSEYQSLYDDYKRQIETHDSLVESYNSKIR